MAILSFIPTFQLALPLTQLFATFSNRDQIDDQVISILTKIVSIYHSLVAQDLPEVFEDNLEPWMKCFEKLFSLPDVRSMEGSILDGLWNEMCNVITLYAQRFEEEIQPYIGKMIELIWNALNNSKDAKGFFLPYIF